MLNNIFTVLLSLFALGYGFSALTNQKQNSLIRNILQAPLFGLILLVAISSIMGVAKITLSVPLFSNTTFYGFKFLYLFGLIPVAYHIFDKILNKHRWGLLEIFTIATIFMVYVYILNLGEVSISSQSIFHMVKKTMSAPINSIRLGLSFITEFSRSISPYISREGINWSILVTSMSYFLSLFLGSKPINKIFTVIIPLLVLYVFNTEMIFVEVLALATLFSLGLNLINTYHTHHLNQANIALGCILLSMILFYPAWSHFIVLSFLFIVFFYILQKNRNPALELLKGAGIAFLLNPYIWGIAL